MRTLKRNQLNVIWFPLKQRLWLTFAQLTSPPIDSSRLFLISHFIFRLCAPSISSFYYFFAINERRPHNHLRNTIHSFAFTVCYYEPRFVIQRARANGRHLIRASMRLRVCLRPFRATNETANNNNNNSNETICNSVCILFALIFVTSLAIKHALSDRIGNHFSAWEAWKSVFPLSCRTLRGLRDNPDNQKLLFAYRRAILRFFFIFHLKISIGSMDLGFWSETD